MAPERLEVTPGGATLSPMRLAVGRTMARSKREIPHFYVAIDVDLDHMMARLSRLNLGRESPSRVTMTAAIVRAAAIALGAHPTLNARLLGDELHVSPMINIGVATPVADGLVAPALLDVGSVPLDEIAIRLHSLVGRARTGGLRPTELSSATFTVSNLTTHPVSWFAAIIVPPQVGILATGRAGPRVVAVDGAIEIRQVMTATLSADHRAVDGTEGASFLQTFKDTIEGAGDGFLGRAGTEVGGRQHASDTT